MGWFDEIKNNFLQQREGDFMKLEASEKFGPGPLVVLYQVPTGVTNEEIQDMLADGAPVASQKGVTLYRIDYSQDDKILERSMQEALEGIQGGTFVSKSVGASATIDTAISTQQDYSKDYANYDTVLLFSGLSNPEMLAAYKIMAEEIYQETNGVINAACAKAVPNAMEKPLRQVLEEIGGDHADAMRLLAENQQARRNELGEP